MAIETATNTKACHSVTEKLRSNRFRLLSLVLLNTMSRQVAAQCGLFAGPSCPMAASTQVQEELVSVECEVMKHSTGDASRRVLWVNGWKPS